MVAQPLLPHSSDSLAQVANLLTKGTQQSTDLINGDLQSQSDPNNIESTHDTSALHIYEPQPQTKYVGTDVYQEDLLDSGTLLSEEDGQFWKSYLKEAKAFDKQLLGMWKESLDANISQAGLFSIIAALFVVASVILPTAVGKNSENPRSYSPLFIGSLSLCIVAGFGGNMAKQWLHSYNRIQMLPNTQRAQSRARQRWLHITEASKLDVFVIQITPGLLEASILLFFIDLMAFSRRVDLNWASATVLNTVWIASIAGYTSIAVFGACFAEVPVQSSLALLMKGAWDLLMQSGVLEGMKEGNGTPVSQKTIKTTIQHVQILRPLASEASAAALVDAEAVAWLLKHSKDDKATALAIHAIPLLPNPIIASVMMEPSEGSYGVGRLIARLRSHLRPGKPLNKEETHAVVGVGRALYHILSAIPRSGSIVNEDSIKALEDASGTLEPLLHIIADSGSVDFIVLARCLHLSITTTMSGGNSPDVEQLDNCLANSSQMSKWALLMLLDSVARFPAFYGAGPGSIKTITKRDYDALARVMAVPVGRASIPSVSIISATVLATCVVIGLHDETIKKGLSVRHDGLVGNLTALLRWQEVSETSDANITLQEVVLRIIKDLVVQHRYQPWFTSAYPSIAHSTLKLVQKELQNASITQAALLLLSEIPDHILFQEMKESGSLSQENIWNTLTTHYLADPEMKSALQLGSAMLHYSRTIEVGLEAQPALAEGIPALLVSALHGQNLDLARAVYLGSPDHPSPWFMHLDELTHQELFHQGLGDGILHCICYAGPQDLYALFQLSDYLLESQPAIWSPEFVEKGFLGNAVNEIIRTDVQTADGRLTLLYASKFYVHLWKSRHNEVRHWDEEVFPTGRGLQAASKVAKNLYKFLANGGYFANELVSEDLEDWATFAESFKGTRWSDGLLASDFIQRFINSVSGSTSNGVLLKTEIERREAIVVRMKRLEADMRGQ